jgi:hypothetical protein
MLSAVAFYFFFSINKIKSKKRSVMNWSKFFLFLGISTFLGGIAHAIHDRQNNFVYDIVWLAMQLGSGFSVFYAQSAAFRSEVRNRKTQKLLHKVAFIQLMLFIPSVIYFFSFKVVALNSSIGLIELVVLFLPIGIQNWKHKTLICTGVLISFLTVYVNTTKLSFASWFNYNDISHVIMFVSILMICRGVKHKHKSDSLSLTAEY